MSGYDAVPDELRGTAGQIGDVLSSVSGAVFDPPSGDYGHPEVQAGWEQFMEGLKGTFDAHHKSASRHGENLHSAASSYEGRDESAQGTITSSGGGLDAC